jgi:four helix bundle protein
VVKSYRDLTVWQRAMDFVVECYRTSSGFPNREMYALCSQLQRAVVSVPANIAEGYGRRSTKEYLHHVAIAYGSLLEAETHLQIAARLGYVEAEPVNLLLDLASEIGKMLNGLMTSLKRKLSPDP